MNDFENKTLFDFIKEIKEYKELIIYMSDLRVHIYGGDKAYSYLLEKSAQPISKNIDLDIPVITLLNEMIELKYNNSRLLKIPINSRFKLIQNINNFTITIKNF